MCSGCFAREVEFIISGHRAKHKNLNNYKESQRCIIYFYEIMNEKLFFITVNNIQDIVLPDGSVQSAIACYLIVSIGLPLIVS